MSFDYIHRFITSLVFTTTIETLVLLLLLVCLFKYKNRIKEFVFVGMFASFATIPYVWFVFPYIVDWSRATSLMVSEPIIFLTEAVLYKFFLKLDLRVALFVSFVCNTVSYFLGPILRAHGLWVYW